MKVKNIALLILFALFISSAAFAAGDKENGKKIYEKKCIWCHGKDGAGNGPAAAFLNPPPRDFTSGLYKFKTTPFDEILPNDEDIFRMIADGMPDSSMPGWKDILKEKEMWDIIAYIKTFAGLEGKPAKQIDFSKQVKSSKESIERGKKLFIDRCAECHGEEGRGDGGKKLKDDWDARTWPRNLTKPWSFRVNNDPKNIFARITTGIPGTQMPSFADPASKKKLSDEERWDVANYAASLADASKTIKEGSTVVKAKRVSGSLPEKADDPKWQEAEPTNFYLISQIIGKERFFMPSNNSIRTRAFYNDKEIAILLEWDDRTKSIPGDEKALEVSLDGQVFEDSVSVQFPVTIPEEMEKPYFGMGDASKPVNIWQWKSEKKDAQQTVRLLNATGFEKIEARDAGKAGLKAQGVYNKGTWRVVMKRSLAGGEKGRDIQFVEGKFIPLAFAVWDGTNGEKGSKHTMTTWYWLFLKPEAGIYVYAMPAFVAFFVLGICILLARSSRRKG
ncbi:MAG: c-type cytochrome [Deltaproteobacteria bacterium]|nr:c-type cytochrome [Deltaproteobacteria bacterium]